MKQKLLLLGLAIVVIAGVLMMDSAGQSGPAAAIIPFTTIAEGTQSKIDSRVNYIIKTQSELAELWDFLKEAPPVPQVDFNTYVVAAVFAGQSPTAGYQIAVTQVQDTEKRVVKIELTKPDKSCVLAQSITAPYQIVKLPKTSLPFTHVDILTSKPCL